MDLLKYNPHWERGFFLANKFSPDRLEILAKVPDKQQITVKDKTVTIKPLWMEE